MRTRAFACGTCTDMSAWPWTRAVRASATCSRTSALSLPAGARGQSHSLRRHKPWRGSIEQRHKADPFFIKLAHMLNIPYLEDNVVAAIPYDRAGLVLCHSNQGQSVT